MNKKEGEYFKASSLGTFKKRFLLSNYVGYQDYFTIENVCIGLFVLSLFYAASTLSDGYLEHKIPGPYFSARDTLYSSQLITDVLYNDGFLRSDYVSNGSASYFNRPPLMAGMGALFSISTGVNEYDMGFSIMLLASLAMIAIMYAIITQVNKQMAILSLPLTLVFFTFPFNAAITWGRWGSIFNVLFLLVVTLVFIRFTFEKPILLGVLIGFSLLTHVKESIYFMAIIFPLWILYDRYYKKIDKIYIKRVIITITVAGILFLGFLPFSLSYSSQLSDQAIIQWDPIPSSRIDIPHFSQLNFSLYIVLIGLVLWIFSKRSEIIDRIGLFTIGYIILTTIGLVFVPFRKGITQDRFFLPITLCFFFGLTLYYLYIWLPKHKLVFLGLFVLALISVFAVFDLTEGYTYTYVNPYTWESWVWIKSNTPSNSSWLSLYGDNLRDDAIHWPSQRYFHLVEQNDYYRAVQSGKLRYYFTPHTLENYAVKNGFLNVTIINPNIGYENMSVCQFDYVYYNKISEIHTVAEYTRKLAESLVALKNMSVVYENPLVKILYNPAPSERCGENDE